MASNTHNNSFVYKCIFLANKLAISCGTYGLEICSLNDINTNFITTLFESITGYVIPDALISGNAISEVHNIQCIIDILTLDVLGVSLSHISAENVVAGNPIDISNLLEVFEAIQLSISSLENGSSTASSQSSKTSTSSQKLTSYSDDNIHAKKHSPIKRKTVKRNHRTVSASPKPSSSSSASSLEDWISVDAPDNANRIKKSSEDVRRRPCILKRKTCKLKNRRKSETQNVEDLYDMNYHKSIIALLSKNDPQQRAMNVKRRYLRNVSGIQKPIPDCNKSFLLPYNLRRKSHLSPKRKHSVRKSLSPPNKENLGIQGKRIFKPCLVQAVLNEFPGYNLPQSTKNKMTIEQAQHLKWMKGRLKDSLSKKCLIKKQEEEAAERQSALLDHLSKDILHQSSLNDLKKRKEDMRRVQSFFRDAKLQSAKIKQYFDEYHTDMKRKLQKENIAEELIVKRTFKQMLDMQKKEILDMCNRAKHLETQDAKLHKDYLTSIQNLYREQYSSLAEAITEELSNAYQATEANKQSVSKDERDLIIQLRTEIKSLQRDVLDLMEDVHFREADAEMYIYDEQQKQKFNQ